MSVLMSDHAARIGKQIFFTYIYGTDMYENIGLHLRLMLGLYTALVLYKMM
jgi:hypothetical protein